jgi:hypothetical protein
VSSPAHLSPDIVAETERLLALAEDRGVPLRALGGIAVRLRAQADLAPALQRPYGDLDFAAAPGRSRDLAALFEEAGYEPDRDFNAVRGNRRLLFVDLEHERKVDVFVGDVELCHRIPIAARLEVDPRTVPLAELLLTKLQIVELNEKDVRDTVALLAGHGVAEEDGETLNGRVVAEACAADWGLWRTITANLAACEEHVDDYDLDDDSKRLVRSRIRALLDRIEREPKTRKWKLRARVGERVRWYDLPEEIAAET